MLEKNLALRQQANEEMKNDINAYTKQDGELTRHNIDKLGLYLTTQNETSKVRQQLLLQRDAESKKRDEQYAAESKQRDEENRERMDRLTEIVAAMTPQKKSSVPTDVTVATAASSVPSINYRDCVPDGMGGWKN